MIFGGRGAKKKAEAMKKAEAKKKLAETKKKSEANNTPPMPRAAHGHPSPSIDLSSRARIQLGQLVDDFETHRESPLIFVSHEVDSLYVGASDVARRNGRELDSDIDRYAVSKSLQTVPHSSILDFLGAACHYLRSLELEGRIRRGRARDFANAVNRVLGAEKWPSMMDLSDPETTGWKAVVSSDAELLYRALLANPADVAECRQGDIQVEMVVSTVQHKLAGPAPTLIDYGAGLGRVLAGLATAKMFAKARYIAVDDPVAPEVAALAERIGAKFETRSRDAFLAQPERASVLILTNTIHHIPFSDLPRQVSALLSSVHEDGVLVIQEIGELREPEQGNVPWRGEDIERMFSLPGCTVNLRETISGGKKVPLAHVLITCEELPSKLTIEERAAEVWSHMKTRTLREIKGLYGAADPAKHSALQYLLITNANLDLNRP